MEATLEDFARDLPDGPFWLTGKTFKAFVEAIVADRARAGSGLTELPSGKGRFFNAQGASSDAPVLTPWQASLSPWTGTGADPHASDRGKRFRLNDGNVNNQTPTNMAAEFVAFGDIADAGITQADAVVTYVYWQASISESQTGQGDFQMQRPQIMTTEGAPGDSLTDLVSPPDFGDDGSFPSYIIGQICPVSLWGGALHFPPGLSAYLSVVPVVSGALNGITSRQFLYSSQ